jgi:hypothetical protein
MIRSGGINELKGAEKTKKKSSSVRQLIIQVSDQLKAGEIRLIETTPQEVAEAKARLKGQRKKRRERNARKKQSR